MPQLDDGRGNQLAQALDVGIDAQGVGLLPQQDLQQFQVLGMTQ